MGRQLSDFEIRLLLNATNFEQGANKAQQSAQRASEGIDALANAGVRLGEMSRQANAGLQLITSGAFGINQSFSTVVAGTQDVVGALQVLNSIGVQTSAQLRQQVAALDVLKARYHDDAAALSQLNREQDKYLKLLGETTNAQRVQQSIEEKLNAVGVQTTQQIANKIRQLNALRNEAQGDTQAVAALTKEMRRLGESLGITSPSQRAESSLQRLNAVGIKSTAQLKQRRAELVQLRTEMGNDARATNLLTQAIDRLDAEIADSPIPAHIRLQKQLNDLGIQSTRQIQERILKIQRLKEAYQDDAIAMQRLAQQQEYLNRQLNTTKATSRQAEQALFGLGFILDDSRQFAFGFDMGLRAIANNIQPLLLSLGTMEGGLKALSSAFFGVGGLIIAFNALTLILPAVIKHFSGGAKSAKEMAEETKALTEAMKGFIKVAGTDLQLDELTPKGLEAAIEHADALLAMQRGHVKELHDEMLRFSAQHNIATEEEVALWKEVTSEYRAQQQILTEMEGRHQALKTTQEDMVRNEKAYNALRAVGLTDLKALREEADEYKESLRGAAESLLDEKKFRKLSLDELKRIRDAQTAVVDKQREQLAAAEEALVVAQKRIGAEEKSGELSTHAVKQLDTAKNTLVGIQTIIAETLALEELWTEAVTERERRRQSEQLLIAAGLSELIKVGEEEEEQDNKRKTLLEQEKEKRTELLAQVNDLKGRNAEILYQMRLQNAELERSIERTMVLASVRVFRDLIPQEKVDEMIAGLQEGITGEVVEIPIELGPKKGQKFSMKELLMDQGDLDFIEIADGVGKYYQSLLNVISEKTSNEIKRTNDKLDDEMLASADRVIAISKQINDVVHGIFDDLGRSLSGVLEKAFAGERVTFGQIGASLLKVLGDLAIKVGGIMVAFGAKMATLKPEVLLSQPHLAVAAGIALIAAGAALRGAASAALKGAGRGSVGGASRLPPSEARFGASFDRDQLRDDNPLPRRRNTGGAAQLRAAEAATATLGGVGMASLRGVPVLDLNIKVHGELQSKRGAFDAEIRAQEHRKMRLRT